ncbi:MAG: hypothetical protein JWQ35_78 [Bacteriovoracaceae bacterium]|nr:hypothetical protein [Bacteriovoracaceae bacterium]
MAAELIASFRAKHSRFFYLTSSQEIDFERIKYIENAHHRLIRAGLVIAFDMQAFRMKPKNGASFEMPEEILSQKILGRTFDINIAIVDSNYITLRRPDDPEESFPNLINPGDSKLYDLIIFNSHIKAK